MKKPRSTTPSSHTSVTMTHYYVNQQPSDDTGDHVVHLETCPDLPGEFDKLYLGDFKTTAQAIHEAHRIYDDVALCPRCLPQTPDQP